MRIFVDASVFVAILAPEPDADEWSEKIGQIKEGMTSAIAIWEAARAIERITGAKLSEVCRQLQDILQAADIDIIAIGLDEAQAAIMAHERFGKGRHPARLNLGDCFAYACATTNNAKLLYKGGDFAQTDLA
jgi:ribonuclease VapC